MRPHLILLFVLLLSICFNIQPSHSAPSFTFNAIFSFGASYEDTGNIAILASNSALFKAQLSSPYGETYFHHPTGRASDGRLVIDRIATELGLPFVPPSMARGQDFSKGANFAVSAATALNLTFFQQNNIASPYLQNTSLSVQLGWFEDMKPSLCNTTCEEYLCKSLFMLGKFGDNDYTDMLAAGKSVDFVNSTVPLVVDTIKLGAERLLKQGVVHLVMPDSRPNGCLPAILTYFGSTNKSDYDSMGCLKAYNSINIHHNALLRDAVIQLRAKFPQARISLSQYYEPITEFIRNPYQYGFSSGKPLRACCGSGEPYHYSILAACGQTGATVCKDPSTYLNWDGVHFTDASYNLIANGWLNGSYADPPILAL